MDLAVVKLHPAVQRASAPFVFVLQCVVLCCISLYRVALTCIVLHCVVSCCIALCKVGLAIVKLHAAVPCRRPRCDRAGRADMARLDWKRDRPKWDWKRDRPKWDRPGGIGPSGIGPSGIGQAGSGFNRQRGTHRYGLRRESSWLTSSTTPYTQRHLLER